MKRINPVAAVLVIAFVGWAVVYGQETSDAPATQVADTYRVLSLIEMFHGDNDAQTKIGQMMFTVKKGDEPQGIQRTDLDAKDYENALNRLASEGWTLVAVNKSNYWVFRKTK
jgi:hypothetical protein